jgi:hypothetical protein
LHARVHQECTKTSASRPRDIRISEQMKLSESHSSLSPLCRTLEVRLANVEQLANLDLPVCLLPDFESFPEANFSAAFRSTPAAYQIHEPKILVNGDRFLQYLFLSISNRLPLRTKSPTPSASEPVATCGPRLEYSPERRDRG